MEEAHNLGLVSKIDFIQRNGLHRRSWTYLVCFPKRERLTCTKYLRAPWRGPPGEKRSGERSRISWAYIPEVVMTNEIARLVIIT